MTLTESIRSVLSQYATFSGRAPRSEYWWWFLFYFVVYVVVSIVDGVVIVPMLDLDPLWAPLGSVLILALLLPNLAVGVRRLHDIDRSGWWLLIGLIPLIGLIVIIYWAILRGTDGPNRFGDAPIPTTGGA